MAEEIDKNLYSRQIFALGMDAQKRLSKSSVLISGMGGLGVEIAKNVTLAGINSLTIQDTFNVTMEDLASNFYVSESTIGTNRALASLNSLKELNHYVTIKAITEELSEELVKGHNCLVLTDFRTREEILKWSEFCHQNSIKFIYCDTRGLFGILFNDFGEDFIIRSATDEQPKIVPIKKISNAKRGVVYFDKSGHGFNKSDRIKFHGVEGMTELNGEIHKTKIVDDRHIAIGDTTKYGKFVNERNTAVAIQVFSPKKVSYKKFSVAIKKPKFEIQDFCDMEIQAQTILLFLAYQFCVKDSCKVSYEEMLSKCNEINNEIKIVDSVRESAVKKFCDTCESVISPMAGIFGGFAGQEVLKAVTGKFTPINQFMSLAYLQSAPEEVVFEAKGDRYDPYRRIFGNAQQDVVENLRYFMIGAGALGCELLKNWALMGLSVGEKGKIYVTDMDKIEVSNLSRQFLFHDKDIGKMKSEAAAESVSNMNHDIHVVAQTYALCDETEETVYNNDFFNNIDGVCTAVDNFKAREFADVLCVKHHKPMLDSGTLGSQAHFQVFVPYITENRGANSDPKPEQIPTCTRKSFQTNTDHTTVWGLDLFKDTFEDAPQRVNKFLEDEHIIENYKNGKCDIDIFSYVDAVNDLLINNRPKTFADCARIARLLFQDCFVNDIKQLLHDNPPDKMENGIPFYGKDRICPEVVNYDPSNEFHVKFIDAAARLIADEYGIKVDGDASKLIDDVEVPEWKLGEENEERKIQDLNDADFAEVRKLPQLFVNSFEKDDDKNGQIDFIYAAANCRAQCFNICSQTWMETKRKAGNIIPAMATTTAMICGFVSLELYKTCCLEKKEVDDYRSGFFNIANNTAVFTVPNKPKKYKTRKGEEFTVWDAAEMFTKSRVIIKPATLGTIIKELEEKTKDSVLGIAINGKLIEIGDASELEKPIKKIYEESAYKFTEDTLLAPITVLFENLIECPGIFIDFN